MKKYTIDVVLLSGDEYSVSYIEDDNGEYYLVSEVQAHLLELERSHALTETALREELKREQEALKRTSELYRSVDAENDALGMALKEFNRKLDPRQWTKQEIEAWHRAMPDLQAAFEALRVL